MKLNCFIVCDFIRREDTGKLILFGIYENEMIFSKELVDKQIKLPLSFFIKLKEIGEKFPTKFKFAIEFENANVPAASVGGEMKPVSMHEKFIQLNLVFPLIEIPKNTTKMLFTLEMFYTDDQVDKFDLDPIEIKYE